MPGCESSEIGINTKKFNKVRFSLDFKSQGAILITMNNNKQAEQKMRKFEAGQELSNRSICDYDCIFTGKVIKRTAKTVTIETDEGAKRCKINHDSEGSEFIYPYGRYSMAPIFRA